MNSIDLINKHNLTLKIESELYPELKIFSEDENYDEIKKEKIKEFISSLSDKYKNIKDFKEIVEGTIYRLEQKELEEREEER